MTMWGAYWLSPLFQGLINSITIAPTYIRECGIKLSLALAM